MLDALPSHIWRLLIPSCHWLHAAELPEDELIFHYRDRLYFVNEDGSVISAAKPAHLEWMDLGSLYEWLAACEDTYDFDDNGEFDYGFILKRMGYLAPVKRQRANTCYQIKIVNRSAGQTMMSSYELYKVSFEFALYHALLRCHELNEKTEWLFEHEVKEIKRIEPHRRSNEQIQFQS
nr:hypothetical protein [Brevibacillus fulvus]